MLRRQSAIDLIPQITADNPLGFNAPTTLVSKKGTLFEWVMQQKKEHPDKVILYRVGEFYET